MVFQRCALRVRIILLRATWICGLPRVLSVVDMVGQLRALQSVGEYQTASGAKQKQYQYFFVAFTLAFGTGSLDYLPMFGIDVYPYGNFGIILYPIIMTYAIVKYGTMDIQIALERSWPSLLLIGSAIPAYAIALIGQRMAFGSINLTYSSCSLS